MPLSQSDGRGLGVMANARFFRELTASSDPFPFLPKDEVRRLQRPALIVRGANTDELHKLVTEELGRLLPNARRVTLPNAQSRALLDCGGHRRRDTQSGALRRSPRAFGKTYKCFTLV